MKAKAEIDRVIGSNRLPTITDWDDLPYITNVVREVIRWRPAVPLRGLISSLTQFWLMMTAYLSIQEP